MKENKERLSVTISPELVRRVDAICEARGESRSAAVERMLLNEIKSEESFVKVMENPAGRAVFEVLTTSPHLLEGIAKLVGDELSLDEAKQMKKDAREQAARGRRRKGAGRPKLADGSK